MDTMFGGFRTRADATYKLLQAPGTAFLVVAAPERDALREAAYFVERLDAERMPLAGLVLNRVHGSGASQLSAERALAAAENLEDSRIVDQRDGKDSSRNSPETHGSSSDSGTTGHPGGPAAASDEGSPAGGEDGGRQTGTREGTDVNGATDTAETDADVNVDVRDDGVSTDASTDTEDTDAQDPDARETDAEGADAEDTGAEDAARQRQSGPAAAVDQLSAGLLRLHAERMRLLSREQRTRDRFLALHPEVAVAEVAALPGDVHDLAGLREIGDRLAADAASN
jgi:hypothetical protein